MLRFLSLSALALTTLALPNEARACSCAAVSPQDAFAHADAVFEGRVESFVAHNLVERATIHVTQAWKGIDEVEVVVQGPAQSSLCGVGFSEGGSFFIYANLEDGVLQTNMCMRTRNADHADEDRAAHGAGVVPVAVVDREPDSDSDADSDADSDEPVDEPSDEPVSTAAPGQTGGCATCHAGGDPSGAFVALLGLLLWRRRARLIG